MARPRAARSTARLPGVVALNGKIHAIGGRDLERKTVATHEIYDPATNTWSMAAPLPRARDHLGIAIAAGRIHVFGGRTNATVDNTARHDVYESCHEQLEHRRAVHHTTQRRRHLFARRPHRVRGWRMQGRRRSVTFTEVEAYDPRTNRWIALPALQPGRHAAAAVAVENKPTSLAAIWGVGNWPSKEVLAFRMP